MTFFFPWKSDRLILFPSRFSNVKSGAVSPTLILSRSVGFSSMPSLGPSWAYATEFVWAIKSDTDSRVVLIIFPSVIACLFAAARYPFVLQLFKGIRTKFVGKSVVVAAAADGVSWLGIIGKDQNRFALGTADFFHECSKRPTSFFPQPERNAGSNRAVHSPHASQTQNTLEFSPIKAYDHFLIHDNNRRGLGTDLLHQFFHSAKILSYVAISKRDLVMRKKLFRCTA